MKKIDAHGKATVRLTDARTGKISHEVTQHNALNLDYLAEIRSSVFSLSSALTVFLTDSEWESPENGLIFPMGKPLGFGKYNAGSAGTYQGAWSAPNALLNQQQNGLTQHRFAWEFTPTQAVGTLRSLYLYFDSYSSHIPALQRPPLTWKGTPYWSVGNKQIDVAAKTAVQYYVADYYTKEASLKSKPNTLTMTGIARDVDTGHIFIYDNAVKKLYEYESEDTDFMPENVIAEHPCTAAYVGKGLISGQYLYFISSSTDPLSSASAAPSGATIYLFRYSFAENTAPEIIDTMNLAGLGGTSFTASQSCAFVDDWLIYQPQSSQTYKTPVLRIADGEGKMGFTGYYPSTSIIALQRLSQSKQLMLAGTGDVSSLSYLPPMAISHLLLDEPIEKDNQHSLSIAYTLSIQE
jgi:hypothetical protein